MHTCWTLMLNRSSFSEYVSGRQNPPLEYASDGLPHATGMHYPRVRFASRYFAAAAEAAERAVPAASTAALPLRYGAPPPASPPADGGCHVGPRAAGLATYCLSSSKMSTWSWGIRTTIPSDYFTAAKSPPRGPLVKLGGDSVVTSASGGGGFTGVGGGGGV